MPAYDRLLAVLQGRRPDRLPFIGRLELWRKGKLAMGTLPTEYATLDLAGIHRRTGFGRQKFVAPYTLRLHGVDLTVRFDGEVITRACDPEVERFPDVDQFAPDDRVGVTDVEMVTPAGTLTVQYTMLTPMLATGARAYMSKHPICEDADYRTVEYILEHTEVVPQFGRIAGLQAEFGADGYVLPVIERIPFQQVLIDYLNTGDFFYALADRPAVIERIMALLDDRITRVLDLLAGLDVPYLQFGDNLDGMMTNPRLFARYCLPAYQRYVELLHRQGKMVGSHTDGNLKPLLGLLAESGLEVCESFSPYPLTPVTVEDALAAWRSKPLIWGGIPSPLLEETTPYQDFEWYIRRLLELGSEHPFILNVVDMVLPNNSIERIRTIAEMVEAHRL
jgi:hypothetical protein